MKEIILTTIELVLGDLILALIIFFVSNRSSKKNEEKLETEIKRLEQIIKRRIPPKP